MQDVIREINSARILESIRALDATTKELTGVVEALDIPETTAVETQMGVFTGVVGSLGEGIGRTATAVESVDGKLPELGPAAASGSVPVVVATDSGAVPVTAVLGDSGNLDAFSRLRVSNPLGLFDNQFTYGLNPLQFEQLTSGTDAAVTHDADNRLAVLTGPSAGAGYAGVQSYRWMRYQPGKSQAVFLTFNFLGGETANTKVIGYSDGSNGVELQLDGNGAASLHLLSDTDNGDEEVDQNDWNLDPMNGAGAVGLVLVL